MWEGATEKSEDGFRAQAAVGLARIGAIVNPESASLGDFCHKAPDNTALAYAHASALERENHPDQARNLFQLLTSQMETDILKASAWFRLARLSEGEERERCLKECIRRNPYHYAAQEMQTVWEESNVPA